MQGARHIVELVAAFGLTALIGLERTVQGKSAGLRTQTIVGTSAALIMLVSKYGFGDVLSAGTIVLDPSRVAQRNWQLTALEADAHDIDDGEVRVTMTLSGAKMGSATEIFADLDGVVAILRAEDDAD